MGQTTQPMAFHPETETSPTTVLVLEDEVNLAELYTTWLSPEYNVRTANTAAEAREQFDTDVDIALIDRRLPDGSGDEVLDWISAQDPHCRCIMISAVNPDVDIVELPFDDYLIKPTDKDEFIGTVRRLENQSDYEGAVRDLYALTTKRIHLETQFKEAELADSEEYTQLKSEISDARQLASKADSNFDDQDFIEIVRRLEDNTEEN